MRVDEPARCLASVAGVVWPPLAGAWHPATGEACEMTANAGSGPVEARLRDIQSITDAAMSRLDDQEFLVELVERVKAALRADTAAVLLLDHSSGNLVATAAAGLE